MRQHTEFFWLYFSEPERKRWDTLSEPERKRVDNRIVTVQFSFGTRAQASGHRPHCPLACFCLSEPERKRVDTGPLSARLRSGSERQKRVPLLALGF